MRTRLVLLAVLAAATSALAQNQIVSPVGATSLDGSGSNSFPWASTTARRYQQLHGDVGGTPKVITQLSFRASSGTSNALGVRTHDIELYMGEGVNALAPSFTFDANYLGGVAGRTLVMPRQFVNMGPQGQIVTGVNPFTGNMDLLLTTPFAYSGANSLVWEVVYYGQTTATTGSFPAPDAEQGVVTGSTSTITGTGCAPTGLGAPMTHAFSCNDVAGTLLLNATIAGGPANSFALLAIGTANPNLAVPGLCANLFSDAVLLNFIGLTDAAGALTTATPTLSTIVIPNTLTGVTLHTQAFVLDPASSLGLPFTASNGRQVTVPASDLTRVNQASRVVNNAGGTTATEGVFFTTSVGYALVTQFTYL
jgi:hypothetical protein